MKTTPPQFYCCVCIRYRGNVSTEPLPSNNKGSFNEPLPSNDKGILQRLPSNDKGTFTEPLPSNDRGYTQTCARAHTYTHTHTHTHTKQRDLISLLSFFQNKESRLINKMLKMYKQIQIFIEHISLVFFKYKLYYY
jgi:hypothetical protein